MNQFIDENCNSSFINSFLKMNQFICLSQINPNELNANSFMNGNGPCTNVNSTFGASYLSPETPLYLHYTTEGSPPFQWWNPASTAAFKSPVSGWAGWNSANLSLWTSLTHSAILSPLRMFEMSLPPKFVSWIALSSSLSSSCPSRGPQNYTAWKKEGGSVMGRVW